MRLSFLLLPMLLAAAAVRADDTPRRPNILIILADDLGYADVGFHGCKDIPTPNLDALAASGVRFSNGYSSHPFCSPMRAGLLAGRYQHRFGYVHNVPYDPQNTRLGLPPKEKTIATRLRESGYVTGMAGKWHLGASHLHHPNQRGFDEFYGFLGGGHDYFEVDLHKPMHEGYKQPLDRNGSPEGLDGYLTDRLSGDAVRFIREHREKPFFYYLAYNAPHGPLQAPAEEIAKFSSIKDRKRRTYAAMVHIMDRGIGLVLAALDEHKLRGNTLIFFLSDNGGPTHANASSNAPLRGFKGDVFEGGIRVPFVASWPGTIPAGEVYDPPVISIDISRTALELAGANITPKIEGRNLIPHITGKNPEPPHKALFWRKSNGEGWAVRSDGWKLLAFKNAPDRPNLFHLAEDNGESEELSSARPATVEELLRQYKEWDASNMKSIFPGYSSYHKLKKTFYSELDDNLP